MNEEHNMTLREKWDRYVVGTIEDLNLHSKPSADWWLAKFDEMLAEDIENVKEIFRIADEREDGVEETDITSILEARRLSIKK